VSKSLSRSQLVGSAVLFSLMLAMAGCTTPISNNDPASAELAEGSQAPADLMARCKRLYGMWARYQQPNVMVQSSQGALAEGGLTDCQHGHFDTGIAELEHLLKNERIPFSPTPATPATASKTG
jgi:hypothetical protein